MNATAVNYEEMSELELLILELADLRQSRKKNEVRFEEGKISEPHYEARDISLLKNINEVYRQISRIEAADLTAG
jgi:hypothetical protein